MQFSEKAIDEFIVIYQRNFNETISREEAIDLARGLVNLYRLFLRPPPWLEVHQKPPTAEQEVEQPSACERRAS